jgi:hypothetical protein
MKLAGPAGLLEERERNTLLSHALTILTQKIQPNAREVVREKDGARYIYAVYGATQPHGGILIVTFHYPGQRPGVDAHYLYKFNPQHQPLDHRVALEQVNIKVRALKPKAP